MSAIKNLWQSSRAKRLAAPDLLRYHSNLLGSDKRVTNFGGGNTSAKLTAPDPLTRKATKIMWIKGSGGDLGSMGLDGFAVLRMELLHQLKQRYRGPKYEDEMVDLLRHCAFGTSTRPASIDTPLHGFVPYPYVDHVHPDAVIAVAAAKNGQRLTRSIYGDEIGWLPWRRPGFELGLWLEKFVADNPQAKGVVLGSHGLFTWANTQADCYKLTIATINRALAHFERASRTKMAFGGSARKALAPAARRALAAKVLPAIRGSLDAHTNLLGHFDDSKTVLEFVNSKRLKPLAALGTSCPDHFLRTKIRPLVLPDIERATASGKLAAQLSAATNAYRKDYAAYYRRCKHKASPAMRNADAVVYLLPGLGMATFAKTKATARIAGEFYTNAINVMRMAETVDNYTGLDEQEAFNIEYWALEEAKLQRMPKPRPLTGRSALITGAAGGIGSAIADKLLADGACVLLTDFDAKALAKTEAKFATSYGSDAVRSCIMDVRDEKSVDQALAAAAIEYGGLDILVSNAGFSKAAPFEETDLKMWQESMDTMATGYFLVARAGFRLMLEQRRGGSIIFISSKNGLAASANAAAYCTAKAAEIHLARCLALEGGAHGIRVNSVNPDAVLRGSGIWSGSWRRERAAAYSISPNALEAHYRDRSLLKRSVYPEDVAAAVSFLSGDEALKSTGNVINVDAGNAISFSR